MSDAHRPVVLLVCGPPASGKSTLGRALAAHFEAVLLDLDVLTGPLTATVSALLGVDDLDAEPLARTRAPRYDSLLAVAVDNVRLGRSAVLVAPFGAERRDPAAWTRFTNPLVEVGGRVQLVWLRLPGPVLLDRMRMRAADRDRAKLADARAYLTRLDLAPPVVPHTPVDALSTLDEQVAQVADAVP